jgi:energy-coupling factor transporter ATP-binding protein EcfA2
VITQVSVEQYGCVRAARFGLTPFHAFIGPNDSGKSTLLRALRTVMQFANGSFQPHHGRLLPFDPLLPEPIPAGLLIGAKTAVGWYAVAGVGSSLLEERLGLPGSSEWLKAPRPFNVPSAFLRSTNAGAKAALDRLGSPRLLRLDPDALRSPSGLIIESQGLEFLDDRGLGLPGVYHAIFVENPEALVAIRDEVKRLFPAVKQIRVPAVASNLVALEIELADGTRVRGDGLSEGLLYYLAYAALRHLAPAGTLLVEEPENGLHPARIREVIAVLRAISDGGTQVIMATHSPLVVNELHPEEVSVVTRTHQRGTEVNPIAETPDFAKRSQVYALGELWLSYADGEQEAPLRNGGARAGAS